MSVKYFLLCYSSLSKKLKLLINHPLESTISRVVHIDDEVTVNRKSQCGILKTPCICLEIMLDTKMKVYKGTSRQKEKAHSEKDSHSKNRGGKKPN